MTWEQVSKILVLAWCGVIPFALIIGVLVERVARIPRRVKKRVRIDSTENIPAAPPRQNMN